MLTYITTDASISPELGKALAIARSDIQYGFGDRHLYKRLAHHNGFGLSGAAAITEKTKLTKLSLKPC